MRCQRALAAHMLLAFFGPAVRVKALEQAGFAGTEVRTDSRRPSFSSVLNGRLEA